MKKGFTLIELMVVIVIIGILAALAIPKFLGATDKAKVVEWKTIAKQIVELQSAYKQQYDVYYGAAKADLTASISTLGFDMPAGVSRFTYWTDPATKDAAGACSQLAGATLTVDLGVYKKDQYGIMSENMVLGGDLQ